MKTSIIILVPCLVLTISSAIPKSDDNKKRVLEEHLSDEEHYENENHNADYDHEAFLGESEAKSFDQLSPEESKERLGIIYDKIDKDKNSQVTEEELKLWIKYTQKRYINEDVDRQWKAHNTAGDDKISWDEYRKATYGFMDESELDEEQDENGFNYKDMLRRDKRRFELADENKDNALTKDEFANFLHPEDAAHMKDVVVQETIEDIDKDKDGKISLDEYIGDMYKGSQGDQEPDWVKVEREQFSTFRDKDKDGKMDPEEVKNWIIPADYDHAEAEAKHLIHESDSNGDKMLSKDEVVEKYDLFVGSQATDFGEALIRHDEF